MKTIITGATGMIGEGVSLAALDNPYINLQKIQAALILKSQNWIVNQNYTTVFP